MSFFVSSKEGFFLFFETEQGDTLPEALATHRCVRAMMESVLCLDKSYKSFHHGHDATFPKACRCRVKVRWLGEVMLHTRPYECDDYDPNDAGDDNDDDNKDSDLRLSSLKRLGSPPKSRS